MLLWKSKAQNDLLFVNIGFPARKRTALHLAVGMRNVKMVRALMQWRRELNNSLGDDMCSLNQRRDMFIQEVVSAFGTEGWPSLEKATTSHSALVGRFEKWLSEERRRLVRVTELRCEECWRKVMSSKDDKGRTPLHWAASGTVICKAPSRNSGLAMVVLVNRYTVECRVVPNPCWVGGAIQGHTALMSLCDGSICSRYVVSRCPSHTV